jgi:hypothetical protein
MVFDAIPRPLRWLMRCLGVGSSALLLGPPIVLASVDVCQPPDAFSHLSLGYYKQHGANVYGDAGRIVRENHDVGLQYRLNDTWSLGVGHRYVILDLERTELQTNGHLHTLFFPLHRQGGSGGNSIRISVAPALSASSNVMKDPGEFSADTFQLLAAIVWSRDLSERAKLRFGVCGDHSFGKYTVYPSIALDWRPHPGLLVELGLPVTGLTYEASPAIELMLRVSPDGNEWHVKSKNLEKQSRLVFRALLVEWAVKWQARERVAVTVGVARAFENRYDVTLLDDRRVELSHDAATRVGAGLEWRF